MVKRSVKDGGPADHLAHRLPSILQYHQTMLTDGVRNRLLSKAIKRSLRPGMSFLDIGAGTGVWAIMAARLGSSRAVAVEAEEALIPIIHKLAVENGVADRIEIVQGRSDDVKLKGKFDLVVSELFDGQAFSERTTRSFMDLRRFIAPGGILIPEKLELLAAPAHQAVQIPSAAAGVDVDARYFREIKLNLPHGLPAGNAAKLKFLAEPQVLISLDFGAVDGSEELRNVGAEWPLRNAAKANCVAVWARSTFVRGIEMDGRGSQSWGTTLYPFEPINEARTTLSVRLDLDPANTSWTVSTPSTRPCSYSPLFALTRLKMAAQMTPHKRTRPKK